MANVLAVEKQAVIIGALAEGSGFVKRHNTLRCTPAMAAGIEKDFWSVGNLIEAAV